MIRRFYTLFLTLLISVQILQALPPEENRIRAGNLPTPYSADEIKAFCKPGYKTRYLFEREGQKPVIQIAEFLESEDPEKARFSSRQESTTGELLSDEGITEIEWKKLQAHASFLENFTTVSEEKLPLNGKSYDCWKYVIQNIVPNQDGSELSAVIMTMWFAKDRPGPPVKMTQVVNGEQGTSMTLMADEACCSCCCCEEKAAPTEG